MWNQPYNECCYWPPYDQYSQSPHVSEVNSGSTSNPLDELSVVMKDLAKLVKQALPVAQVCGICSLAGHVTDQCPSLALSHSEEIAAMYGQEDPKNNPYSNTYNSGWWNHPNSQCRDNNEQQSLYGGGYQEAYSELYPQYQHVSAPSDLLELRVEQLEQHLDMRLEAMERMIREFVTNNNQQHVQGQLPYQNEENEEASNLMLEEEEEEEEVESLVLHEETSASHCMAAPMPQGNITHSSIQDSTNPYASCVPFPNAFYRKEENDVAQQTQKVKSPRVEILQEDILEDLNLCHLFEDEEFKEEDPCVEQIQDDAIEDLNIYLLFEEDLSNDVEFSIKEEKEEVPSSHIPHSATTYASPIDIKKVEHVEMVIGAHIRTDKEILLHMIGGWKKKKRWKEKTKKKKEAFMYYLPITLLSMALLSSKLLSEAHMTSLIKAKRLMEHVAEVLTLEE